MWDFYLEPFFWGIGVLFLIQLGIHLFLFRRVAAHKADCSGSGSLPAVSVVISAKDEEENLRKNLPAILEQDFPDFEVIIVDDQSEDDTRDVLAELSNQHKNLKVITIGQHIYEFKGKKLALTLAFKAASYDILLMTDADCRPLSNKWLRLMQTGYTERGKEFVLGYSPYKREGGLVNLLICFETFYTALQYFSFALSGNPYMGVGRNLSYRKDVFFRNKGFAPYLKVPAGDDDLFVNMHSNERNTAIQLCEDSFMLSEPKKSWKAWMRQKRRHTSVSKYYKSGDKRKLGLLWLMNFLFYAAIIAGCCFPKLWIPTLGLLFLKLIIQSIIYYLSGRRLYYPSIWLPAIVLDPLFQLILMPWFGLMGMGKKKKSW